MRHRAFESIPLRQRVLDVPKFRVRAAKSARVPRLVRARRPNASTLRVSNSSVTPRSVQAALCVPVHANQVLRSQTRPT